MDDTKRPLTKSAQGNIYETTKPRERPDPVQRQAIPPGTPAELDPSHISSSRYLRFQYPSDDLVPHSTKYKEVPLACPEEVPGDKDSPADPKAKKGKTEIVCQPDARKSRSHFDVDMKTIDTGEVPRPPLTAIPQTHLAIGLMVMCCFSPPFGLLAIYCSLKAAAAYRDGDKDKGICRARASIILSLVGIMMTMVIVSSLVVYVSVNKHSRRNSRRPNASALGF